MKNLDREKKNHAQLWLSMPVRFEHPSLRGVKKINFYTCLENKNFVNVDAPDCLVLYCRYSQLIPKSLDLQKIKKCLNKFVRAEVNSKEWRFKKLHFFQTSKTPQNI